MWSADVTNSGADYAGPASVEEMPPIFPKLWRRLDTYGRSSDVADPDSIAEFKEYLETLREERVFIISESRSTGFDNIIFVEGETTTMTAVPEDLVVVSV